MRPEKITIVADINAKLKGSAFLLIADYGGMKVKHFEELRKRLGDAGAKCSVVKNTFLKIAAKELGMPELNGNLSGQTAMITGESDIAAAAKVLKAFVAEFEKPLVKVGILDNAVLDAAQIKALADLPPKDVLRATLLGVLQAPASKLVRTLNEPGASLARLLKARAEAMPAEAPAAEAAPEAPAAEAAAAPETTAPEAPAAEAPETTAPEAPVPEAPAA